MANGTLAASQIEMLSQSGTGIITITPPATNTNRAITLPDAAGEVVLNSATQTLTNKTIQGGALTLATAVTASGTSVDFTSIPSWVKRITVMFNGVSTNGTSELLIQIGDSGGIEVTGYLCSSSAMNAGGVGHSSYTTGYGIRSVFAANTVWGALVLTLVSGNTWVANGTFGNNLPGNAITGGSKTLSDTLTQVRITTVNGTDTFDAGTINIIYEG
jgi:hypothetical protein